MAWLSLSNFINECLVSKFQLIGFSNQIDRFSGDYMIVYHHIFAPFLNKNFGHETIVFIQKEG